MRIVHVINQFVMLTGAELHVYELAREQVRCGHSVSLYSPIQGGELRLKAKAAGIGFAPLDRPDLYHVHSPAVLKNYQGVPAVATLHDSRDKLDRGPIRRWIVVREDQQALILDAALIPNGFDLSRFHPYPLLRAHPIPTVLAVGNFRDDRRQAMLESLRQKAKDDEVWVDFLGTGLHGLRGKNIAVHPPAWHTESFLAHCDVTAGLYVGRTTIEGWLCNRPGWIYQPDGSLACVSPPPDVAERYDIVRIAERVEGVYREAIG